MNENEKQEFKELIKEALKEILSDAFDDRFGCKHNWVSKGGATANNYRQCTKCGIMDFFDTTSPIELTFKYE